jgi:hypothetical protein
MAVVCLCRERYHWLLIPGYAAAFRRRGIEFFCANDVPFDTELEEILRQCPERPSYVLHFESGRPILPLGLERSEIPTVCFQVDTHAFTHRRIRWSALFDHVAVFHPGFDEAFRRAGHPGAFLLPQAARREFFEGPELTREFEIGWVGQTSGLLYRRRAVWFPKLASSFRTNDWSRSYTLEEVAEVYRRSRVVVNIGRDDASYECNLRVFEVLASGALLLTSLPTELTAVGFEEGVHFVGYRHESEIVPLVRRFLQNEGERARIANAGREKALREHTYDCRVAQLLQRLEEAGDRKIAPARSWPDARVGLIYLDFFAGHGVLDCAAAQFRRIAGRGFRETIEGAGLLGRAWIKHGRARRK